MPSYVPGGPSPAVSAQCPVSPPSLSPEVTARLRAEMSSARVKRGVSPKTVSETGESPAEEEAMEGCASDGLDKIRESKIEAGSVEGWGGASLQEEPVQVVLKVEPKVVCDCKKDDPGLGVSDEDPSPREEGRRSSSTKEHLLELELKAIKMEYESAKDRWQREREAMHLEMSDVQAAAQQGVVPVSEEIRKSLGRSSEGVGRGAGSSSGSVDGSGSELKALKNEYLNAQTRWDNEREDLQNQFRNVLQVTHSLPLHSLKDSVSFKRE